MVLLTAVFYCVLYMPVLVSSPNKWASIYLNIILPHEYVVNT